ncbi:MAG: hypothetical protein ACI809_002617, partial [Candidatus Azotimanducaceae bacterium]
RGNICNPFDIRTGKSTRNAVSAGLGRDETANLGDERQYFAELTIKTVLG